jgi:hypothetical protein
MVHYYLSAAGLPVGPSLVVDPAPLLAKPTDLRSVLTVEVAGHLVNCLGDFMESGDRLFVGEMTVSEP